MNLLRAASWVSLLTLASRVTGLVRELFQASLFGASVWTDAFNVAFRIPNLLRRLFAEGAFSQAFVPLLAEIRTKNGDEAALGLINAVATLLFWVLVLTCIVGVLAAPVLVWLMASGLERFDSAVVMTRIMFPYIGFMSLVALASGILNTWKHFTVPAATPLLLNVAVIGCAWLLVPRFQQWGIEPVYALAVGVMIGGVLQLAAQVPVMMRLKVHPTLGLSPARIKKAWQHPGVRRVLRQMAPALLGVSVAQISLLINTQIASHVGVGAVSWLTYADRLMEFPTALLGVALGVILIPQLSTAQAQQDMQKYSDLLDWGLRLVCMMALPCAVALLVFPQPLVAVLYHHGAFNAADVAQTVRALQGYGVGLMGLIAVKILAPGFYAKQDIRTPVKIAISVLILTQVLNVVFVPLWGHAGLALSIGLAALVNALWLFIGLRRGQLYRPAPGWGMFLLKVGAATFLLGAVLVWGAQTLDWVALRAQPGLRISWLTLYLASAAAVYFSSLWLMGVRLKQFIKQG
jgi:putative peptidoglycan lipid II flippase